MGRAAAGCHVCTAGLADEVRPLVSGYIENRHAFVVLEYSAGCMCAYWCLQGLVRPFPGLYIGLQKTGPWRQARISIRCCNETFAPDSCPKTMHWDQWHATERAMQQCTAHQATLRRSEWHASGCSRASHVRDTGSCSGNGSAHKAQHGRTPSVHHHHEYKAMFDLVAIRNGKPSARCTSEADVGSLAQ